MSNWFQKSSQVSEEEDVALDNIWVQESHLLNEKKYIYKKDLHQHLQQQQFHSNLSEFSQLILLPYISKITINQRCKGL